jgi:hypothetical protein
MLTDQEVYDYADRLRHGLTGLGFSYQTKGGDLLEVGFKRLQRAGDRWLVAEVDCRNLPPRVNIARLEAPEVLTHLSAICGRRVRRLNTVGLSYVIELKPPPPAKPWPTRVELPDQAPQGLTYAWPFGVDQSGAEVWVDLLKFGHMLVGGKSGAGKSTFVNAGLVALLRAHTPATLRLLMIDPKSVELWGYAGIPHLVRPPITDPDEAAEAISWLVGELGRREALFKAVGAKSLIMYNAKAADPLPLLLTVIDEATDLTFALGGPKSPPLIELIRVSSKGRALGCLLLLATQNPKAEILNTAITGNMAIRVALKVDTYDQSRVILGRPGAEDLPAGRPGRLAALGLPGADLQVLQGFFVEDQAVADLVAALRTSVGSPISANEAALVVFARDHLDGAFKLSALYEHFRGVWSWRQLQKVGRSWEVRGWLTKPTDAVSPRFLTGEILNLVDGRGVAQGGDEAIIGS